jgi:hypothetical protein
MTRSETERVRDIWEADAERVDYCDRTEGGHHDDD